MAQPTKKATEDQEPAAPASGGGRNNLLLMIAGALILTGVSSTATWLLTRSTAESAASAEAEEAEDAPDKSSKAEKKDKEKDKKAKKGKKNKEADAVVVYLPLDPPFVVNSQDAGTVRFLQVSMEVMARDPLVIEDVKKHMPLIRNNLVMLLSSQTAADVQTREGKEKVRAFALGEVQKVLQQHTGKPGVEALYFTSFVMQ